MTHKQPTEFDALFEMALTLELVEDGDEIKLEDLKELLREFTAGLG